MMLDIGISANLKGFKYLTAAVKTVYFDPQAAKSIVTKLYGSIAVENTTTYVSVERALRTARQRVIASNNWAAFRKYFGTDECPTVKKMIVLLAERLREKEHSD